MMNSHSSWTGAITIFLIACIALPISESLWIPIPRGNNRIPQLVRTVNPQRQAASSKSMASAMMTSKRGGDESGLGGGGGGEDETAAAYHLGLNPSTDEEQGEQRQAALIDNDDTDNSYDDMETHWPISPRACLVLMKILHAQTADIMEQRGDGSEADFYQVASYYQPATRTLVKCMELADRGYVE